MEVEDLKRVSEEVKTTMPFINGIESNAEYEELISLMGELVEDYDSNQTLINMLFPVIEQYEEESDRFREFNEHMSNIKSGVSMLAVIIDQHGLKLDELPEIGGKSYVSQILSGKKSLTLKHIEALSARFGIPPYMFIDTSEVRLVTI